MPQLFNALLTWLQIIAAATLATILLLELLAMVHGDKKEI